MPLIVFLDYHIHIRIKDYSLEIENPCKIRSGRLDKIRKFRAKSIPTNAGLTELFIGTQMMNRSGAGMDTFKKTSPLPIYEYDDDYLSLIFPYSNRNAFILFSNENPNITYDEYLVYEFMNLVGDITRSQVQSEFNLTEKTANNRLNKLVKEGLVIQTGKGRSTKYKIL